MRRAFALLPLLALAACSGGKPHGGFGVDADPAVVAALNDPLMTDPDLVTTSRASLALGGGEPASGEMPPEVHDPDWTAAASADAERIAGRKLDPLGEPPAGAALAPAITPPAFAALLPRSGPCLAKAGYGFVWAAALPEALPVYPRGHAEVAAGNDLDGCRLRVVFFTSPVPVAELAAFYDARVRAAGLAPAWRRAGGQWIMTAQRGKAGVLLRIETRDDGLSAAALATQNL